MVKSLPAKQEIQVQSLGWKDSLEREMTTHFSILVREIPMNRGARQAAVHGSQKSQTWLSNYTTIRWTYINLFLVQGSSLLRFLCRQKFMQVDLKSVNKIWYDLLQILIWIVSKRSNKSVIPSNNLVRLNVSMSVV